MTARWTAGVGDSVLAAIANGVTSVAGSTGSVTGAQVAAAVATDPTFVASQKAASVALLAAELAANPDVLIAGTITRDSHGAATSASVIWPDGTPGTYTADTVSTAFPGAVDAYHVTYGSPVTRTYTQAAVTRNASGAVTQRPAIAVS